ncbi:MAG: BolA family transcriptional regulator [Rhodocyclaceae bacterium]|nr:BolA family transcriptional regulator [Rhodocyclaceae bacterium]MCP5297220.1 BolA family transcriptional regulator [Zoogloeaceae bacterium]PKO66452.1 MAG: BolA family transcriptional regulator [Betaproteobacteria bacterium HGW-Betaproteobacteria-14]MBZ0143427.1 BolA family transcriptional regulator [Rhodocyclaceae bacterium]MCB1892047.1 BolA family transcriptional regulator [Rhodocyclaceae bacterium]
MTTISAMQEKLAALDPQRLDIADDSAKHAGHAGAREGGGHYRLTIVSARFAGCGTVQRHRLIYEALGPMMRREIHALSIKALTPDETD